MDESNTEEARWQMHLATEPKHSDIAKWRQLAVEKRQSLREQYAKLRHMGGIMATKGWVKWDGHTYYGASFLSDRNYKERKTIEALFKLQENISQQAMMLLELEHACDCEEQERDNQPTKGTTNDSAD